MNVDWLQVYHAAQRANLAYEMDPAKSEAGFSALGQGLAWLGLYQNGTHQAVACLGPTGDGYLSISGTRFHTDIGDLLEDTWLLPKDLGDGVAVTAGAFDGMEDVWAWANGLVDPSTVWNVEGHSLGAWRTRYTPVFLPPERIGMLHSFESPKAANSAYWNKYQKELSGMVSIVNDRDFFVSWPLVSIEWEHPAMLPVQWFTRLVVTEILPSAWPGGTIQGIADHSMDIVQSKCRYKAGV